MHMSLYYFLPLIFTVPGFIIIFLVFLAPVILRRDLALATVTSLGADGTTIWMGMLGSCARSINSTRHCVQASTDPEYDFSTLPTADGVPFQVVFASHNTAAAFMCLSLVISAVFFFGTLWRVVHLFTIGTPTGRWVKYLLLSSGIVGSLIGSFLFLFLRMLFGQAIMGFNMSQGNDPELLASFGNLFLLALIGYGLFTVALLLLYMDLHYSGQQAPTPTPTADVPEEKEGSVPDDKEGAINVLSWLNQIPIPTRSQATSIRATEG